MMSTTSSNSLSSTLISSRSGHPSSTNGQRILPLSSVTTESKPQNMFPQSPFPFERKKAFMKCSYEDNKKIATPLKDSFEALCAHQKSILVSSPFEVLVSNNLVSNNLAAIPRYQSCFRVPWSPRESKVAALPISQFSLAAHEYFPLAAHEFFGGMCFKSFLTIFGRCTRDL